MFIPLVLAILLSVVLIPVVSLLRWVKLGRVSSVIVAVLLALGIVDGIGAVIGTQAAGLAGNLPQYRATVQRKVAGFRQGWLGKANQVLGEVSHHVQDVTRKADAAGTTAETRPASDTPRTQLVQVLSSSPRFLPVWYPGLEPCDGAAWPLGRATSPSSAVPRNTVQSVAEVCPL